ncbi:hypothetical protein I5239_09525, partial [Neisseria gonorrhoeae]|nr:hypothetical protein [Neisseria gonorrhoeae]
MKKIRSSEESDMSGYTGGLVVSGGISLIDRLDIMENVNRIVAEGIAAVEAAQ